MRYPLWKWEGEERDEGGMREGGREGGRDEGGSKGRKEGREGGVRKEE